MNEVDISGRGGQKRRMKKVISQRAKYTDPKFEGEKRKRKIAKKYFTRGQAGEGDRSVINWKPKHLFAGKMGKGTSNKR